MANDYKMALAQVAEDAANQVFIQSYVNDENRALYQREGLGIRISQWLQWDGKEIMEVFRAALEDANYHTEAAVVQGWLEDGDEEVE